jgi:DNA helicase-2/ATP-dependent DNA helicase PcrA
MSEDQPTLESALSDRQRAIEHDHGPMLVAGAPGTGKTELLARRLGHLAAAGNRPECVLMITPDRTSAARLRGRCEALLAGSFEELWIGSWDTIGERLLREYSEEAGLEPFFDVLGRAERLAMLLDRLDRLPLRRHEIRGNPAGLLARLLERIDTLKTEAVSPGVLRTWAAGREREASGEAAREGARRELEFAELYARHDRMLAETGSLDAGDLVLELSRLLRDRADVRERIGARFGEVMAD